MNLQSFSNYIDQENLVKVSLHAIATAGVARCFSVNPIHAVLMRVATIALQILLRNRNPLKCEGKQVEYAHFNWGIFNANNRLLGNAVLIGAALTVLNPPSVALLYMTNNLGNLLADRISLFKYDNTQIM